MEISIIAPDLSANIAGRAFSLGKCLESSHEIKIIGPIFGDDIWEPIRDDFDYSVVPGRSMPEFSLSIKDIVGRADSDFIIISTQRFSSLMPGIVASKVHNIPYLLDIVDLELDETIPLTEKSFRLVRGIRHPMSYTYTYPCQKLAKRINNITVVSSTLQYKFGGRIIPQVRDKNQMNPELFDRDSLRSSYGLSGKKVILFLGTPQPYKGITDLVQAFERLDVDDKHLLLVGFSDDNVVNIDYIPQSREISILEPQPFGQMPKFYAMADIVAVPQRDTPKSRAQTPAKIIDAMAMATPVVSTKVADIETVLGGGGLVVPPGKVSEISLALEHILLDPEMKREIGLEGRKRFETEFSFEVVGSKLIEVINHISEEN